MESFAERLQELVLYLRDEGHLLSPVDQHMIERWWEAGYPEGVVLRAVWTGGLRLKARKKPPRGLPLKSLAKVVEREGQRVLKRQVGSRPAPAPVAAGPAPELAELRADLRRALDERPGDRPLQRALDELAPLESLAEASLLVALLAVSHRYYDARLAALPPQRQRSLREAALQELGTDALRMRPDALDETLGELQRRHIRDEDPVLDPDRFWNAP